MTYIIYAAYNECHDMIIPRLRSDKIITFIFIVLVKVHINRYISVVLSLIKFLIRKAIIRILP